MVALSCFLLGSETIDQVVKQDQIADEAGKVFVCGKHAPGLKCGSTYMHSCSFHPVADQPRIACAAFCLTANNGVVGDANVCFVSEASLPWFQAQMDQKAHVVMIGNQSL